jgi:amidase
MRHDEYAAHDGLGLAALVRQRQVSAAELLDAALARIDAVDPQLHAVVRRRDEAARREAAAVDPGSPFAGVPFLLKDLLATLAGEPTGSGNRLLSALPMAADSELVRRLRRAGLVIAGRTATPEFGLTPYTEPRLGGPTRNPWSAAHSPGGSSGGSAAAVAAGMVPLASGGDGGGSIRIPASCCGLFGFKPSRGALPTGPQFGEVWRGFVTEHALTRSVRDSAALLDATWGADGGAPYAAPALERPLLDEVGREPGRLRIAWTDKPLLGDRAIAPHADCRAALEDAVRLLGELGHELVEAAPDIDPWACAMAFTTVLAVENWGDMQALSRLFGRRPRAADFEPATFALGLLGRSLGAAAYVDALRLLQQTSRRLAPFFERHALLLTPTLATPPIVSGALQPSAGERRLMAMVNALGAGWLLRAGGAVEQMASKAFAYIPYTPLFNATGQPAMSLPLHWNAQGLPIGVQLAAPLGADGLLLRVAAQLEAARPWAGRRPPL